MVGKNIHEIIETIEAEKDKLEVMSTGFPAMDDQLDGGFLRKEFIVIGANTGIGKSYIAGQFLLNIARQGFKCAYFSLEISNEMIVSRLIGSLSNLKPTRIRLGMLDEREYALKIKAKADLETLSDLVYFYDHVYTLQAITEEVKREQYEFAIVDFLQNVVVSGADEYTRMTKAALTFQSTAKEVDGTILALSQVSNFAGKEGSKNKILEYKGSGAIATTADLGFFMERGEVAQGDQQVQLVLRKNRRGNSGLVFNLYFKFPGGMIYEA